jgi:vacuolar-type H+-ATPase subunit C/Vma6
VTYWGDLVARARGLSTHLLSATQLAQLADCGDLPAFAALAAEYGAIEPLADPHVAEPHALELAARRRSTQRFALIVRWAGERMTALTPLMDDEDRRALRALARGAVGGIPGPERMAGLVPTPLLPVRALEQLSRAGDLATIGALLIAWRHPFGTVVSEEGTRQTVDLFRFEVALARAAAQRAIECAGSADAAMRHYVERTIDLENLSAALVLAAHHTDTSPASVFISAGALVTLDDLASAADTASPDAIAQRLATRFRGALPLVAALHPGARTAADAALSAMIGEFHRRSLREPLGLATVIAFWLRQRAELQTLQQITWRITMGVPHKHPADLAGALA